MSMDTNTSLNALLPELVACVEDDLAAQKRILTLVEEQLENLRSERGRGLEELAEGMVDELRGAPERTSRRDAVLARFAAAWGLEPKGVTLSMVTQNLGERAEGLGALRAELRSTTAEVVRSLRKFSALVSTRRRLVGDVLRSLLESEEPGRSEDQRGVLLDAEV